MTTCVLSFVIDLTTTKKKKTNKKIYSFDYTYLFKLLLYNFVHYISTAGGSFYLYFVPLFSSIYVHLYIYSLLLKSELLMH